MESLVSVIIPVFHVEKYLDKCISSVLAQTYRRLEVILVDDGSNDRCPAMCDQWQTRDDRIRVLHKMNGGLSHARNAGMSKSAPMSSSIWTARSAMMPCLRILRLSIQA